MDLLFTSIEGVSIAIGAGAAFIFCSFFILSLRNHVIGPTEYQILKRLSLYSSIGAALGLACFIINTAFYFETGLYGSEEMQISLIAAKLIFFSIALLGEMTLRKIHLPTLMRHQKAYFHLSDSMHHHPDPLVKTAAWSTVSWFFVIFMSAIELRGLYEAIPVSFISFIILYIVVGFLTSAISTALKEQIVAKNKA